jgi:hypothetical protein
MQNAERRMCNGEGVTVEGLSPSITAMVSILHSTFCVDDVPVLVEQWRLLHADCRLVVSLASSLGRS